MWFPPPTRRKGLAWDAFSSYSSGPESNFFYLTIGFFAAFSALSQDNFFTTLGIVYIVGFCRTLAHLIFHWKVCDRECIFVFLWMFIYLTDTVPVKYLSATPKCFSQDEYCAKMQLPGKFVYCNVYTIAECEDNYITQSGTQKAGKMSTDMCIRERNIWKTVVIFLQVPSPTPTLYCNYLFKIIWTT